MNTETYGSLEQASKHYHGERNFCGVIAVALAAGCKFGKARAELARLGRKTGGGSHIFQIHDAIHALSDKRVETDLTLSFEMNRTTLKTIARRLPQTGTFLVYTHRHVSVVRDGRLEDWAAETGSRKKVQRVHKVA